MNGTIVRNQLIVEYASGSLGPAKSLFTATYLFLNSRASSLNNAFESFFGDALLDNKDSDLTNIKYTDCIQNMKSPLKKSSELVSPLSKIIGPLEKVNWKQIYKGFQEFSPIINDSDEIKLIKMDPGVSVPLHSHGGKEYILVLKGSFCDEYGKYNKGDIQINDQKVKHTPTASKTEGCVCLSITEKEVIFFGKYGSFLNLFTFIKSFFK